MNRLLPSLPGESIEITHTVPLSVVLKKVNTLFLRIYLALFDWKYLYTK